MIIQSLCNYYDILNEEGSVSDPGYSKGKVSFAIEIDDEGKIKGIIDKRSGEKKPLPDQMVVPLQKSRSGKNPPAYFLSDNAKYVFGVTRVSKKDFDKNYGSKDKVSYKVLEESEKDYIIADESTKARFELFKQLHISILKDLDDESARAFLKFIENYNPEEFLNNPKLVRHKDEILDNANFIFTHKNSYVHEKKPVKIAWEQSLNKSSEESDCYVSQCLISGNTEPIAKTHQLIQGVANANSAGGSLVGFNECSFESYGKKQSYNAPIGESSMFKYTTALKYLLSESKHRVQIGDSTVVFWADAPEGIYEDISQYFINPVQVKEDNSKDQDIGKRATDRDMLNLMKDILDLVRKGHRISQVNQEIDEEKMFYILGLSPNNARLSVRFWYMNEFGDFIRKVSQHYIDQDIESDFEQVFASPYRLIRETVPKTSDRPKPNPILSGLLMRSILDNTPYPIQMYNAILSRVKVERTINSVRAGFIKAYLLRLARTGSPYLKEDMITVNLNETSQDVPYRLGRLFAVLEKAQTDTAGKGREIGSTINSKYFSSVSTTPAVVFPVLIKLAQHHIAKSDYGVRTTKDIEEILSGVEQFPAYMNLEEQGMFMLGYYHQRKANYKKKEDKEEAKAVKEDES